MASNALIQTRIDESVKIEAARVLARSGLTVSDAVRLMLTRVVQEGSLPFEVARPNAETRAAMAEADTMLTSGRGRFADASELFDELDGEIGG